MNTNNNTIARTEGTRDFLEHIIPEFDLKIKYPSDWTKTERNQINSPNTSILAIFRPPQNDQSLEQAVAIGRTIKCYS